MQMILTENKQFPIIESHQAGLLQIDGKAYHTPIILSHKVVSLPKDLQPEQLQLADFQAALADKAELIIVGTGDKQKFLPMQLLVQLSQQGIGIECMNTASACRTIMLLQAEGRLVYAWLWP